MGSTSNSELSIFAPECFKASNGPLKKKQNPKKSEFSNGPSLKGIPKKTTLTYSAHRPENPPRRADAERGERGEPSTGAARED